MARTREKSKESSTEKNPPARRSRPMWSGSISFGLVNIPVRLYPGIRVKDVRFHLLHDKDKSRLQEKLVCPVDQQEIPRPEAVKGYEVGQGRHVVVTQEEMDSLAPKASRTIELLNVVDIRQIDPVYFNRPFYLLPEEQAAKAYLLLVEALRRSGKGAIAKFVMREKEYIGAIRPIRQVLCLDTLHFAEDVISTQDLGWTAPAVQLRDPEIKMALQLLESFESKFEPRQLHDDYREAMRRLIEKKVEGEQISVAPQAEEETPQVIDLMEALKKSVSEVQRQKSRKAAA